MEVKPGYKQTEVGVIPEDWEVTFLIYPYLNSVTTEDYGRQKQSLH